jgi:hypothetical protein
MKKYWPAECLAESVSPFTFEQVCAIAVGREVSAGSLGVRRYRLVEGEPVYRLFYAPTCYEDRTEAYIAAGAWHKKLASSGVQVGRRGLIVVLDAYLPARPSMHLNTDW